MPIQRQSASLKNGWPKILYPFWQCPFVFYGQNSVIVQMNKTKFVGQRMPHPIPSQWSRMGPGERATRAENGDGADHFFRCFLQTGKSKNSPHGRRRPSLVTRRPAHGQQTSGGKEGRTK